jgi:hypothetical protein
VKNEKPTTLELAQLAAQLRPEKGCERESVKQAITLWTEAERELEQVQQRAEYLRDLVAVIYTAAPDEWQARIKGYPGEAADIDKELLKRVPASKVHQTLFRDKRDSKQTRKTLFVGLMTYAQKHGMTPPPRISRSTDGRVKMNLESGSPNFGGYQMPKIWEVVHKDYRWPTEENQLGGMRQALGADELSLHGVRWAVEVRQRQIAANKTRVIPASLTEKPQQDMDSIQYKPKRRG